MQTILNRIVDTLELKGKLVLIMHERLHDSQKVNCGWNQRPAVDINSCVEVIDKGVEHHIEVELFTIFRVLEHVESIIVRDKSCDSNCHGDCRVFVANLTHD